MGRTIPEEYPLQSLWDEWDTHVTHDFDHGGHCTRCSCGVADKAAREPCAGLAALAAAQPTG